MKQKTPEFSVFRIGSWELHRSAHGSIWVHDSDKREPEMLVSRNGMAVKLRWLRREK